jgi:hypothetical protein
MQHIIKSITSFSMYLMLAFTQKTKKVSNTVSSKTRVWPQKLLKGKHLLLLIRHSPCFREKTDLNLDNYKPKNILLNVDQWRVFERDQHITILLFYSVLNEEYRGWWKSRNCCIYKSHGECLKISRKCVDHAQILSTDQHLKEYSLVYSCPGSNPFFHIESQKLIKVVSNKK